ncbi:MAG: hypothetical protein AAF961_06315 [Planctomycetota bacterium]
MYKIWRLGRKVITIKREQQLRSLAAGLMPVRHRSTTDNVYHCCVWKTASQWVRNVFSSSSVYRYSGLLPYDYENQQGENDRPLQDRTFDQPAPRRRIVSPLYADHRHFDAMPKPDSYRAFFVCRDPRDLVVSHYFSSRYSHASSAGVEQERAQLSALSES